MEELSLFLNESSNDLSRRVFVKGIGFMSLGVILGTVGGCDLDKLLEAIRKSTNETAATSGLARSGR